MFIIHATHIDLTWGSNYMQGIIQLGNSHENQHGYATMHTVAKHTKQLAANLHPLPIDSKSCIEYF